MAIRVENTRWKLVREFPFDSDIREASALALGLRDDGRFNGGSRPVVRVRNTAAKVIEKGHERTIARTELIMQRIAYRTKKFL